MISESGASYPPFDMQRVSLISLLFSRLDNDYHGNTKCKLVENLLQLSAAVTITKDRCYLVTIKIYGQSCYLTWNEKTFSNPTAYCTYTLGFF